MLNCKLHVVDLSVGECNHMSLKGFRGLESVTGDAGVTRGLGALKEITGVTTGYRRVTKKLQNWHFSKGVVHGFGQRFEILPIFSFIQNTPRKIIWLNFR